jgi:hypothetical protein
MDNSEIYAIVQLGIIGGCVALSIIGAAITLPFIARSWFKSQRAEMELSLKQSMIERGMTAQQICAVIEANGERRFENTRSSATAGATDMPRPPVSANEWREWAKDLKGWARSWKHQRTKV